MEVGKAEMKAKLEIANNLICYHLNINKIIFIAQAKNGVFTVTRPTISKPTIKLFFFFLFFF